MTHHHKMTPMMPFVHGNIYTLRSMPPHASPIQQNQNTLSRSPPITTERILFCFHEDKLPKALYHIKQILWIFALIDFYRVDIKLEPFKPNDIWSNTEYTSKVVSLNSQRSGSECAPYHRPAKIQSTGSPTPPDDFLEKYNNYLKPIAEYTIQGKINATRHNYSQN